MRVKVARAFRDIDAGVLRGEGDEFEVTPSRLEAINSTKYGKLVHLVETPIEGNEVAEEAGRPAKATKRRTRGKE